MNRKHDPWSSIRLPTLAAWLFACLGALLGAMVTASPVPAKALPAVLDTRVVPREPGVRVIVDLSAPVDFDIFTLADPFRIVVDLEQVRWRPGWRSLEVDSELLRGMRYGLFRPGTSRIVLDCKHPAQIVEAAVTPRTDGRGYRLAIDLVEVTPAAFIQTMATVAAPVQPVAGAATAPAAALNAGAAMVQLPIRAASLPFIPPSRKPASTPGKRVVVIDPGHGGADPGATSRSGILEKRVTLAAARLVRDELRKLGRYNVVLTRDSDQLLRLRDRVALARAAGADLFISVHADANPSSSVRGASVYTLSEKASDAEAAALAERENKADLIAGVNLSGEASEVTNILIDLAQRESMNKSGRFAGLLVDELGERSPLLRNSHRFAGFAVLKAPDVPSVLVEIGHLSNPQDEKLLQQERHVRKLAAAIAEAVDRYFVGVEQAQRQ